MKKSARLASAAAALTLLAASAAHASSHMDAPLITFDDAANTTDVYAFVSERNGQKYLTTALAVYPFEEPGIGPNKHTFDDDVLYEIHVALGNGVARGRATLSYRFQFATTFRNPNTILQSYLGVIEDADEDGDVDYDNQNLVQTYTVERLDRRESNPQQRLVMLGSGTVPPNNQGVATPLYNRDDDGNKPARDGVADANDLDDYTTDHIAELTGGHRVFAGQRDDGFYGDIQSIFDLLQLRSGQSRFDSQGGFNVHTIVLEIPVTALGGDMQVAGVYATTSRRRISILRNLDKGREDEKIGRFVQVARQGNPLFNEAFVALADKDLYSRTRPARDAALFAKYAEEPELAALINLILFAGEETAIETDRSDLVGIFIPDMIRVDLSTDAARLAGGSAANPNDEGFSRMSIFGGDTLVSQISEGFGDGVVPGGWPNGRRFGDDVIDIGVSALLSDLRDPENLVINPADGIDNVNGNDIAYNKVFPYAATPLNGRNHAHH